MKRIYWMLMPFCLLMLLGTTGAQTPAEQAEKVLAQARAAFEAWDYAEALTLYRSLLKDFKDSAIGEAEAAARIGDCLFQLGRHSEAAEAYSKAIREFPTASAKYFPRLKVADCLVKMGRIEDARRLYQAAREAYGPVLGEFSLANRLAWLNRS